MHSVLREGDKADMSERDLMQCLCIQAMFMSLSQFTLTGSLPFNHHASRFAPSKSRLQTVELCNLERVTDVSLGFLHSS